ncbi:MAG: hypothetical protein INR64_18675 [Caulobacteraceae bacterium]|nr:hypothetical protein [Caulobacter sp.]
MDYTLDDALALGPSRGHHYRRVPQGAKLGPLAARLGEPAVWHVALKLAAPPSADALLGRLTGERDVAAWAMAQQVGDARVATCVISTYGLDWHVAVVHEANFSLARHVEAVDHLANAVFRARPEANEVWTALPVPEPDGAEESLAALGFTHVPSELDRGTRRTYGLFRDVWTAYRQPG